MKPESIANTTVLADFDLDHRILFRAHLGLAKRRLIIGFLLLGVWVAGLVYFFTLIAEQTILWQTSPLFIGLPLMGVVGQVLRIHATARKYVSALPPAQRKLLYMFRSQADGFDVLAGESSSHISWTDISKVVEKPTYFLIYHNHFDVGIFPKSAFHPADLPTFRDILKSSMGPRAQTLNA